MEKNTTASGNILRKPGLVAVLLLAALGLSACVVAPERDHRGGWRRHHHQWSNDGQWNGHRPHGNPGWQGHGGNDWWKGNH